MTPQEIIDAGEALYQAALRDQEFAHDGEQVPREHRAEVMRVAANKLAQLADYIDAHP